MLAHFVQDLVLGEPLLGFKAFRLLQKLRKPLFVIPLPGRIESFISSKNASC